MSRRYLMVFVIALAALWAPLTSRAGGVTPINSYTVVALGTLGGGYTTAYGLNDAQVVGTSVVAGWQRAFLWQNGGMTDLGTLGGSESWAYAVSSHGQVVGSSRLTGNGSAHAFLWEAGTGMRDLGTLGGTWSTAYGINDAGQVAGWAQNAAGAYRAFLWQNGQMVDLGVPGGYVHSYAYGINASGQVVGDVTDANGRRRAFRWTPAVPNGITGTMVALPQTTADEAQIASAINGSGAAAGHSAPPGYAYRPTLWGSAGGAYHLPFLYHMDYGYGYAINDAGYVVGQNSYDYWDEWGNYTESYAFLWDSVNGTRDLSALTGGVVSLEQGRGINATGQVVGNAYGAAYLLTPSPIPTRPQNLWAGVGDTRVTLSWNASSGADSYTVKRSAASGGPYSVIASGVTGTIYTDTAVVNGTTYYYVVSAVNAYGESANSNEAAATPMPPPAAPTGLTAAAGDQQVSLSWNASDWASYYEIWRSITAGGPYDYVNYTYETSYLDTWLQNGTTHYYVVVAVNMAGTSPYSNEASATPMPPPPPPAPTGLTATAGDQQVALSWNASTGAEYYEVKRSTTAGGPHTAVAAVGGTSYTDTGLVNGTTYYYVVCAVNSGGASPNSSEVSATPTGPPPPAAPTNLTASAGKKKVSLKWTQSTSSGVTQNRIYRSTTSGGPYSLRATISGGTSFDDTRLTSGVTYYYVVTAVSSSGKESAYSNQASAKPR